MEGIVPRDWRRAVIVPLYKGKGEKGNCRNYRGISLLSVVGKVYAGILVERVRRVTEGLISEEQGAFRSGRGCVDQIFTLKQMIENMREKKNKLYLGFMDLQQAYDSCLLYTSDAADERSSVDLGGRRIIKKKKK